MSVDRYRDVCGSLPRGQPALRLWFYPADAPEVDAKGLKAAACRRIEAAWARLDAHLAAAGPHLLGAELSTAEL